MIFLTCCDKPGFCPFYKRELWGLIFRRAHNLDCTQSEHDAMREMLLAAPVPVVGPVPAPVIVNGPGTELVQYYASRGLPSCQACRELAARMNQWGVGGCRERLNEIVDEIMPRAKEWAKSRFPWVSAILPGVVTHAALRLQITSHVNAAITAAESRY